MTKQVKQRRRIKSMREEKGMRAVIGKGGAPTLLEIKTIISVEATKNMNFSGL